MKFVRTIKQEVDVKYMHVACQPRYWEDAHVDGVCVDDGATMPHKKGDMWDFTIDLAEGKILLWPEGVTAETHLKVCDAGTYALLDEHGCVLVSKEGYVPSMLAPQGGGYGDYVIMEIDGEGKIRGFRANLSYFEEDDEH